MAARQRKFAESFGLALGVAVLGVLAYYMPLHDPERNWGEFLEAQFGFSWLTRIRGPRQDPLISYVVSIDRDSLNKWDASNSNLLPREIYACLMERLLQWNAALIVMDVAFAARTDPVSHINVMELERYGCPSTISLLNGGENATEVLADLMTRSRRTLTLQSFDSTFAKGLALYTETPLEPLVEAAALATARFPLPTDGRLLNWYNLRHGRDDSLVLPALAARIVEQRSPGVPYAETDERFLVNYYGPPGSKCTVSLLYVLTEHGDRSQGCRSHLDLRGRVVFVGRGWSRWDARSGLDEFRTPYFAVSEHAMSGVEIGATIFDNLRTSTMLRQAAPFITTTIVCTFAIVTAFLFLWLPLPKALPAATAMGLLLFALSYYYFVQKHVLMPLLIPLLLQLPLILLGGSFLHYQRENKQKQIASMSLALFVPRTVARAMATLVTPRAATRRLEGVCMCTDVKGYTATAERLDTQALADLTTEYFAAINSTVLAHGGEVVDILGDGSTSLWPCADAVSRLKACRAALACSAMIATFNSRNPDALFPTRFGLHTGWVSAGTVGGGGRLAAAVVGDIVNTTSRIETLNKQLGTSILCSAAVVDDLDEVTCRHLGRFLLAGKTQPLTIYELCTVSDEDRISVEHSIKHWCANLDLFRCGRWEAALDGFIQFQAMYPKDGPVMFYINTTQAYLAQPPEGEELDVIRLSHK